MTHIELTGAFQRAIGTLADEAGRIKDRLMVAYSSQLSSVRPEDLPSELVDQYLGVRYALSDADVPYGYGERASEKLRDMSEADACALAGELFEIYTKLLAETGAPALY